MEKLLNSRNVFAVLLLGFGLSAAQPALSETDQSKDSELILAVRANFNESIAKHDPASMAKYFDDDYQITAGSGKHYRQTPKEGVESWVEIFRNNPDIIYVRTPDNVEVSTYLELASENGHWVGRWTSANGDIEMGGRYFAQWRKVDGDWKIRAEVFATLFCNGSGCK